MPPLEKPAESSEQPAEQPAVEGMEKPAEQPAGRKVKSVKVEFLMVKM
jgi:hypothetical protein